MCLCGDWKIFSADHLLGASNSKWRAGSPNNTGGSPIPCFFVPAVVYSATFLSSLSLNTSGKLSNAFHHFVWNASCVKCIPFFSNGCLLSRGTPTILSITLPRLVRFIWGWHADHPNSDIYISLLKINIKECAVSPHMWPCFLNKRVYSLWRMLITVDKSEVDVNF